MFDDEDDNEELDNDSSFMNDINNNRNTSNNNYNNNNRSNNNYNNNNRSNNNDNNYRSNNNNNNNYRSNNNYRNNNYQNKPKEPEDISLYKPYSVMTNNDVPEEVINRMFNIVKELQNFGYTVRTSANKGLEERIENNKFQRNEVYLPWRNFDNKNSKFTFNSELSLQLAKMFHNAWDNLKDAVRAFLARNTRVILGQNCKSSTRFLMCYSEDGCEGASTKNVRTGNIGHPIAICSAMSIPVFNFKNHDAESRLREYLKLNERN